MKIKKTSWHYRLLNAFTEAPENRCAYIRKFFSVALVLLIAIYVIGSLITFPFLVYYFDFETIPWYGRISMMVGFGVCAFFVIFIGAALSSFLIENYRKDQYTEKFVTYGVWNKTKDWFNKRIEYLCEPIEFVD